MHDETLLRPSSQGNESTQQEFSREKQVLKWLMGDRNYYTLRANRNIARDRKSGKPILLVHQMGKVGSTSVVASLEDLGVRQKYLLYQTHFLSPTGYEFLEKLELDGHGGWSRLPDKGKSFLSMSAALSREVERGYFAERAVKVISLVRDPVATNLSGFFHNTAWWSPDVRHKVEMQVDGWQMLLWQHFLDIYPHDVPAKWFDMEIKPLLGIDVMAVPFSYTRGFQIYESQIASMLLLKLEGLRTISTQAFQQFMGIDDFVLAASNKAENKWYADIYDEFKRTMSIPDSYLRRQYTTSYARHFYSESELDAFRTRWSICQEKI